MRENRVRAGLGTWQFFLAFVVVISHLWAGMIDGPAAYAVWGFFVLSGYLMTLVLTTKYSPTPAELCSSPRTACYASTPRLSLPQCLASPPFWPSGL